MTLITPSIFTNNITCYNGSYTTNMVIYSNLTSVLIPLIENITNDGYTMMFLRNRFNKTIKYNRR